MRDIFIDIGQFTANGAIGGFTIGSGEALVGSVVTAVGTLILNTAVDTVQAENPEEVGEPPFLLPDLGQPQDNRIGCEKR